MKTIKTDKEKLLNYKRSTETAKNDLNRLTMDVTMDKKTRKYKVNTIAKYAIEK